LFFDSQGPGRERSLYRAILATIERAVLHPDVVQRAMRQALGHLNAPADTTVPRQTAP
jgi:hypothetical protein